MGSILDRWRVHMQSPTGPVLSAELCIRASSLAEATALAQSILNNEGGAVTGGLEIVEVERVN